MNKEKLDKVVCPNCDNEFNMQFEYCPHCGQRNRKLDLHLKYFLNDFISSSFNIDSKIFRTLRLLVLYPGKLTKEFLAGRRTKYIPPVRLYLIFSLVYFTLLSFLDADIVNITDTGNDTAVEVDSVQAQVDQVVKDSLLSTLGVSTSDSTIIESLTKDDMIITMDNLDDLDQLINQQNDSLSENIEKDSTGIGQFATNKLRKLSTEEGKKAFQALMRKYISIGMFVLMPVTALIFFLLFYKRTYYIQHLVFVLHLQSMMYILFIVLNFIELGFNNTFMDVLNIILFLLLLLIWIKRFYEIGWWKTVWKTVLFLFLFGFSFLFFLAVVGAVSAFNL